MGEEESGEQVQYSWQGRRDCSFWRTGQRGIPAVDVPWLQSGLVFAWGDVRKKGRGVVTAVLFITISFCASFISFPHHLHDCCVQIHVFMSLPSCETVTWFHRPCVSGCHGASPAKAVFHHCK